MMVIPYVVKPSPVHGLGVFATAPLVKGAVVWRYTSPPDYRLTEEEVVRLDWQQHRLKYGYQPIGELYVEFPGDGALFINHSLTPNCVCDGPFNMIAARDIPSGEEILFNYFEFDEQPESGGSLK